MSKSGVRLFDPECPHWPNPGCDTACISPPPHFKVSIDAHYAHTFQYPPPPRPLFDKDLDMGTMH